MLILMELLTITVYTNKTDHHNITDILLKVPFNTKEKKPNKQTNKQTNIQTNKQINLSLDVTIIKMTNMRFILLLQNNLTSEFSADVAAEMT